MTLKKNISSFLTFSLIWKIIFPLFCISSGFLSGFFYKQYLGKEECLNLAFSNNQEAMSQSQIEEISQLLNQGNETGPLSQENLNANQNNSNVNANPLKDTPQANNTGTGKFVGSQKSDKFYPIACHFAKRIKEENKVWFASVEEGEKAGRKFVECNN